MGILQNALVIWILFRFVKFCQNAKTGDPFLRLVPGAGHERRQFVAQAAETPAEAMGFSGGFRGLYSERH